MKTRQVIARIGFALGVALFTGSEAKARFLQVDPVGYKDDLDLYAYVHNDPTDGTDPSGRICVSPSQSTFCERSAAYDKADQEFGSKTDYFAAVSAMTANLANMDIPLVGPAVSGLDSQTRNAIDNLSQGIADFNKGQMDRLRNGDISGSRTQINSHLVRDEQKYITKRLDKMRADNRNLYNKMISGINRSANGARQEGLMGITDSLMSTAAGITHMQLGHDIDYANESDRITMGNNMIGVVQNPALAYPSMSGR